ncbi:MAG: hypothetical protein IT530_07210 [Burkholderiales bacterium]|nr:hypothetical protein [Burkholderiales bacterium]
MPQSEALIAEAADYVFHFCGPSCFARFGTARVPAQLCALANGGRALTTKAVADLLPDRCDFRRFGPQHLKNVARPVEVVEYRSRTFAPSAGTRQDCDGRREPCC